MISDKVLMDTMSESYNTKLILCADNTLKVVFEDEVLDTANEIAYKNLKEVNMLDDYLALIVEPYIKRIKANTELDAIAKELGC